jgi:hypothetical protein
MTLVSKDSRRFSRGRSDNSPRTHAPTRLRDHVVNGAQAAGERGDRVVIGDVQDLGDDAEIMLGSSQFGMDHPHYAQRPSSSTHSEVDAG